jgi:septum site-determining protein MinC
MTTLIFKGTIASKEIICYTSFVWLITELVNIGGLIMSQSVVIKSNRYGIHLVLDKDVDFETILKEIVDKFKDTEKFFKAAKLAISFEGRELTTKQEQEIIDTITNNTSIKIFCIIDNDPTREEYIRQQIEHYQATYEQPAIEDTAINNGGIQFYHGTLRSGQSVQSDTSIVVIGDVNPGAAVSSYGNIVVLGSVKGNIYAGIGGDDKAFIFALDMDPIQIRIGSIIAKSPDKTFGGTRRRRKTKVAAVNPQIAYAKGEMICIEPLTKESLTNI